ncbi:MAG: hypothetical protein V1887_02670 [Candidatus Aenigmatarchaeota archaeon]
MEIEISRDAETVMKATLERFRHLGANPDADDLFNYFKTAVKDIEAIDGRKYGTEAMVEYVGSIWSDMGGPEPVMAKPPSPAVSRQEKFDRQWEHARPKVLEYLGKMSPAPELDNEAVKTALGFYPTGLLGKFGNNGRALDNELEEEERKALRQLEDQKLVRGKIFETSVEEKINGRKNNTSYSVFYWEPAGKSRAQAL